jgi:hypothetical protein
MERDRINAENELYIQDINHRFNQESRRIQTDGQERLQTSKANFHHTLSDQESQQTSKLNAHSQEFTTRYQKDAENYKKLKDTQDSQFKKERLGTNLKQWEEISSTSIKPTAEEQMMNDLKGLLSKLKNQMDDFE